MFTLLAILHIVACLVLILIVLLQSGKAGDLASAFGGSSSQTAFGVRSAATILTKGTTLCAITFMITSLGLAILFTQGTTSSVMEELPAAEQSPLELDPEAAPPAADQAPPADQAPAEEATPAGSESTSEQ